MDNSQNVNFTGTTTFTGNITQTQQNTQQTMSMNFESLYDGLETLLKQVGQEPDSYNKAVAVQNLKAAKAATVKKDENAVIAALKSAGKWTWEFATKVGVSVVSDLVKQHVK